MKTLQFVIATYLTGLALFSANCLAADPPKSPVTQSAKPAAPASTAAQAIALVLPKLVVSSVALNMIKPTVDLKATLSAASGPLANRTLTFWVDGKIVGEKLTAGDGSAIFTYSADTLAAGTHTWSALFEGDGQYTKVESKADMIVNKAVSTLTVDGLTTKWYVDYGAPQWILYTSGTVQGIDKSPVTGPGQLRVLIDGVAAKGLNANSTNIDINAQGQFNENFQISPIAHNVTFEFVGNGKFLSSFSNKQVAAPTNMPPSKILLYVQDAGTPSPLTDAVHFGTPLSVKVYATRGPTPSGPPAQGVNVVLQIRVNSVHAGMQGATGVIYEKKAKSGSDGYATFTYNMPFYAASVGFFAYADDASFLGEAPGGWQDYALRYYFKLQK